LDSTVIAADFIHLQVNERTRKPVYVAFTADLMLALFVKKVHLAPV